MEQLIERAVERSITYMHENLGEQITIDDIARTAMFSKFYFTRFFLRVTGISPGRFLSALRIQEAKDLLLTTDLTVTQISYQVGYNSIGTFSSRFRESVGLSPTAYRHEGGRVTGLPGETGDGTADSRAATVSGRLHPARFSQAGPVFLGLFPERLPHRVPVRWAVLAEPGEFLLDGVPAGCWHLIASAAPVLGHVSGCFAVPDAHVAVRSPVPVQQNTDVRLPDLRLRPRSVFDPPVLLAPLHEHALAARSAVRLPALLRVAA